MAPDSLTPADGDGGQTPPATDLISRIEEELTRIEQESQNLKQQAAQKDQQLAEMRIRLATLAGTKLLKTSQIGQMIPGKGVYMGQWQPKDRKGNSLGKTFAVYAAPEDLMDESGKKLVATFQDTAKRVTALKNWHGHDGGDFANDTALYQGLAVGSAVGKWFIPTRDLLAGTNLSKVHADNLYANKDKGDLKGTFTITDNSSGLECPVWYWSSTEHHC